MRRRSGRFYGMAGARVSGGPAHLTCYVFRDVLGTTALFVVAGIALGVAGALYATRVLRSLIFDVAPTDPIALGGAALVLGIVAIAAALGPARRAVRVSPLEALRIE